MSALVPTTPDGAFRLAEMMATGKLVPAHLQRSPGDCLMVIEQAMRWGMSPFAVAQCTSVIQGKLMFEGKLVAAALQSSGILDGRLDYEFHGEGDKREIVVRATLKGDAKPKEITLRLADAKTSNGMWTKQPDQQLVYAGTRVWGRRWAPEVMLGVYSPEEMETTRDTFTGTTITGTATTVEPDNTPPTPPPAPTDDAMTPREMADAILAKIGRAPDENGLHLIAGAKSINRMRDMLKEHAPALDEEVAEALKKRFNDLALEGIPA